MEAHFDGDTLGRVAHFDLTYYAEMTKNMLNTFDDKDGSLKDDALGKLFLDKYLNAEVTTSQEESKGEASAPVVADEKPMDMAAMMLAMAKKKKKDAAAGIGSSKSKKGAKGKKAGAPAAKAAPTKAAEKKEESAKEPVVVRDRVEQIKYDTDQLFSYLNELRALKAGHIETCLDIVRHCNNCEFGKNEGEY